MSLKPKKEKKKSDRKKSSKPDRPPKIGKGSIVVAKSGRDKGEIGEVLGRISISAVDVKWASSSFTSSEVNIRDIRTATAAEIKKFKKTDKGYGIMVRKKMKGFE